MAAPTVRSVGTWSAGQTLSFTAPAPTGVASGDLLVCTVEGGNNALTASMTNWTQLCTRAEGTSTGTTITWIFARLADGSANDAAAITLGGTINHASAQVIAITTGTHGVSTVGAGTELVVGTIAGTVALTAAAGRTITNSITVTADSLILVCVNSGFNGVSSAMLSNVTNANLASLTERMDNCTTQGTGGGVGMWTGTCAGTTVGTTTYDSGSTENDNKVHIGIPPVSTGPQTVSPGLIAQDATLFAPKVNLAVSVGLIAQDAVLFSPKINTTIQVGLIAQDATLFSPTVSGGGAAPQTVSPGLIAQDAVLFSPKVNEAIAAPLISQLATLFSPKLNQAATIPLISQPATLFSPTITAPAGPQSITAPLNDRTAVLFSPKVNEQVQIPLLDRSATLFSPSVRIAQTVSAPLLSELATLFAPSIVAGAFGAPVDDPRAVNLVSEGQARAPVDDPRAVDLVSEGQASVSGLTEGKAVDVSQGW